jgi:hypothetical protein
MDFETAFASFLVNAQKAGEADYANWSKVGSWGTTLVAERGRRYIRIVAEGNAQRSAWAFVDTTNGDVLKADGWKAPAKGSRGNIYDAQNGVGRVRWTSIR